MTTIQAQCALADTASQAIMIAGTDMKNAALSAMADSVEANRNLIVAENERDLAFGKEAGLSAALLDRLTLTESRLQGMADSLRVIRDLDDPIGDIIEEWTNADGLLIKKVRVGFGVIGIIYEARPNVTADAIGLAIKAGSAVVLRGSKSAVHSNKVISDLLRDAAVSVGLPGDGIQLLEDQRHEGVTELVRMKAHVDLVLPRGGASLIQRVVETATVPAIETGVGNCHVFVDSDADLEKALAICVNAKVQRPSVCNSAESILIHSAVAEGFVPQLVAALQENGVEIRGDEKTRVISPEGIGLASEEDWSEEFLDLVVSLKIVASVDEAISHIGRYGSLHTEAIVTENSETARRFQTEVDAAAVIVNASTRFTDGGVFGFGAEMGISTQKLHARGPMGLKELTTYKYLIEGNGQVRG